MREWRKTARRPQSLTTGTVHWLINNLDNPTTTKDILHQYSPLQPRISMGILCDALNYMMNRNLVKSAWVRVGGASCKTWELTHEGKQMREV